MEQTLTYISPENNNLETFSVVWFETSSNETRTSIDIQQHLRASINFLKIFQDSNECENHIRSTSKDDRIILIVNDHAGEELVSRIHQLRQVFSIYVYSICEERKQQWIRKFSKVNKISR